MTSQGTENKGANPKTGARRFPEKVKSEAEQTGVSLFYGRAHRGEVLYFPSTAIALFLDEQILAENHLSLMLMPTAESGLRSWSSVFRDVVFLLGPGADAAWFIEAFCL